MYTSEVIEYLQATVYDIDIEVAKMRADRAIHSGDQIELFKQLETFLKLIEGK